MTSHLGDAVRVGRLTPGSPEWEHARVSRVGGSEVAALVGLSPFESWFSMWHRRRGLIGPVEDTALMWWGRHNEQAIADRFAYEHPEWDVRRIGTYVNREREYQVVSPDRLLVRVGGGRWELLECKQAHDTGGGMYDGAGDIIPQWGPTGTDQIPIYYRCQCLWGMDAFGIDTYRLAAYFGGDDYREYVIRYDEAEALVLRKRAVEFIEAVRDGIEPDIDAHAATYRAVRNSHPDIESDDVELPPEMAESYLASLDAFDQAKAAKSENTARVARHIGTARRATYGTNARGRPRSIAYRTTGGNNCAPYLVANPRPKPKKEIT